MVARSPTGNHRRKKYVTLKCSGYPICLQPKTASNISLTRWMIIEKPVVNTTMQLTHSASGGRINFAGEVCCTVSKRSVTLNIMPHR